MRSLDIKALESKFNKLTLRERVITFFALILCTGSMTYFWMLDPGNMALIKAEKKLQTSYVQQNKLEKEINQIKLRLQEDPTQKINNEIVALQQTSLSLEGNLNSRLIKFIHANKMPLALSKVLAKSPGIKVNYLKTLPVHTFKAKTDSGEEKKAMFYKHTLEVQLTGNYNAVYQYLRNLEALQDKFYWHSLHYEVTKYPLASVTLQIYTLSDQQDLVSG